MLKQLLILISFVLFTYYFFPNVEGVGEMIHVWNYSANFSSSSDVAQDVAVDSNNNIIVVGYDTNTTGNYAEWRVMKFDQNRNLLWSKAFDFNITDKDYANSVAVDSQNNITVVGSDFLPGNSQWRIIKLNPNGDHLWNDTINPSNTGIEEARGVAVDSSDNIIVVGDDNATGSYQWRIRKLDKNKNLLWEKTFDISTLSDNAYSVAVDGNDDIIVVGSDRDATSIQWRIMKLDSNGDSIWNYTNNISATTDEARDVAVDSLSNIIVVGYDRNTAPASDQWRIMKLSSSNGYHIWNYSVDPTILVSDRALGVAVDSNNNIIVVGFDKNKTLNFEQWRIMKFDTSGVSLWNETRNISTNFDRAWSVANASNNNIIIVGSDYLPSNFQWRIMEFTLCGNGYLDSTSGEICDYKTSIFNPHPDSPCQTNQYCNNLCSCSDVFNVWLEPSQMLFTISEKTPINLYIKNTGYYTDTDTYSIQPMSSNPSIIDVDISGSSPTNPVSNGTTELVRPWVTVFATTSGGTITFNITSTANPEKYTTATLNILEGLPISLFEFNTLGLILIIVLAGFIHFLLVYKN